MSVSALIFACVTYLKGESLQVRRPCPRGQGFAKHPFGHGTQLYLLQPTPGSFDQIFNLPMYRYHFIHITGPRYGNLNMADIAHIANCLFDSSSGQGPNSYIAGEISFKTSLDEVCITNLKISITHHIQKSNIPSSKDSSIEKENWRMFQPTKSSKYNILQPKEKVSLMTGRRTPDWDSGLLLGQSYRNFDKDGANIGAAFRLESKDQPLMRRRKTSTSKIKTMTTVQEIQMDSRELIPNISYMSS